MVLPVIHLCSVEYSTSLPPSTSNLAHTRQGAGASHPAALLRSRRGSVSSPCIPTLAAQRVFVSHPQPHLHHYHQQQQDAADTASSLAPPHPLGAKKSALGLVTRAVGFGQNRMTTTTTPQASDLFSSRRPLTKKGLASELANELLTLIFRNLMDRKSILNCSLVSTHWHGPARIELARITQDMPFNGQGLVHAIRTRFAADTFPFLSMALFDKLVCNLSELYYHSNPETKEIFAPASAPDMLYHLFWTFLFIDQDFRNPRARSKVTCNYFVRLLQKECGYPREHFDKKVLKRIYEDILSQPLLPAPHLIRTLQETERPLAGDDTGTAVGAGTGTGTGTGSWNSRPRLHRRQTSLRNLANARTLGESFKRVRRWWKSIRDEGEHSQAASWVSETDTALSTSERASPAATGSTLGPIPTPTPTLTAAPATTLEPTSSLHQQHPHTIAFSTSQPALPPSATQSLPNPRGPLHSSAPSLPQESTSVHRSMRPLFGTKSDLTLERSAMSRSTGSTGTILSEGFTSVPPGWHLEGDGLDKVVQFPKSSKPSTLGSQHHILQYATLMHDMDLETNAGL
ncbi:unnamed protein product [Mortierella alpina]